jgi:hypothetical protein
METMLEKIYTKFKDLKIEADKDCKFNKADIDNSFTTTNSLIKYINKKTEWNSVYRKFESERKDNYRKLYEFYQTDFPLKLNGKDEYQLFIESDPAYVDIFERCLVVKEILVFIDSTIETLKSRQWEIKEFINWAKFSNGQ